jgi:glyoxylase-like metal-dependent hydrolase (beta-lactamase superfamily II)
MRDANATDAPDPPETTPREFDERLRAGEAVPVLDLRDRDEVERWPIERADVEHVPYSRAVQAKVTGDVDDLVATLPEPVVVVCPVGEASAEVAAYLREANVEATNLAGGMDAWARLLVATDLDAGPPELTVTQYERPASGCLSYLVHDGDVGAVVDPLWAFADRYVADAAQRGLDLRFAVDTHVHADHLSGVRAVAEQAGEDGAETDVVLPEDARDRGLAFEARTVDDGDVIEVGDATLTAVHAPGHTSEMTVFRAEVPHHPMPPVLLTGDSLFVDGVARPDLEDPDGAEKFAGRLYDTLHERLHPLAGDTVVAPGHRGPDAMLAADCTYTATLDALAVRLESLSMDRETFVEYVTADLPPRPTNHERIVRANLGVEDLEDGDAFELELGPNNCGARAD